MDQAIDLYDSCFQIIDRLDIGFLLMHLPTKKIVNMNEYAKNLIAGLDWNELVEAFGVNEEAIAHRRKLRSKTRIGQTIIGYTLYFVIEDHVTILFNDITEKERLREMAEATAMMDNVAYILAGFSHEVGNPLNSIKTMTSVLKENIHNFSLEKTVEYLENILSEVSRIEFLLRMFKVFRSYEDLETQLIDMRAFFERFVKLVERDLRARGIKFGIKYHQHTTYGIGDERALQQVMLNVLTNAMDAVSNVDDPMIQLDVASSETRVIIKVTDNGVGVPPEERDKLFLPFYTTKAKGTGMGLTIVKNLLTRMGGTIEIKSLEKGTEVTVLIPNTL